MPFGYDVGFMSSSSIFKIASKYGFLENWSFMAHMREFSYYRALYHNLCYNVIIFIWPLANTAMHP